MNSRQMEIFVNIVKYGNFSNAAKNMYLSQPAISANIDLLEKELDTKLLIRQGRKATLTEKGHLFYNSCVTILGMTEQAINEIKTDAELSGTIRVISSFVPGLYLMPQYVVDFHRLNQNVHFEAVIRNTKEAYDGVMENIFDIGFLGFQSKNESLIKKHIFTDKMVLVTPNTAEYRELKSPLPIEKITDFPFVMRTIGSSTQRIMESELKEKGIGMSKFHVVAKFDSGEAILQAIKYGMGVSVLSAVCIQGDDAFLAFEIEGLEMERNFYAVRQKNIFLPERVLQFFDSLPDL